MSLFIAQAHAQAQPAAPGFDFMQLVFIGGLFAIMYFMLIRPQRKKQKEHQQLIEALSKGDEVVLTSGMLGKITDVGEVYITVDVGNNVLLKFQKLAVHAVLPKGTIKSI